MGQSCASPARNCHTGRVNWTCDHATESGPNQGLLDQRWDGPTVNELSDSAPWLRGKVRRDLGRTSPWHGPASRRCLRPRKSVGGDIGSATRRGCTFDYETRIRTTAKSGSTGDPRTSRPRAIWVRLGIPRPIDCAPMGTSPGRPSVICARRRNPTAVIELDLVLLPDTSIVCRSEARSLRFRSVPGFRSTRWPCKLRYFALCGGAD